jgi:hypothetical protein
VIVKPPVWYYECSSGRPENEGRYQSLLLSRGWGVLTPRIRSYAKWMGTKNGAQCRFGFHLAESKKRHGTMDIDAGLLARAGERGPRARILALGFPKYAASLLRAYDEARVLVYLGSLLCDSMEAVLDVAGLNAWFERVIQCLSPYLELAKQTGRVDLALDMSSGLDTRDHPGLIVLAWLESELARFGCELYVEGVPSPQGHRAGERARMFARNWICQEPNWTHAVTLNPAPAIQPELLTGEGIRWWSGHWKNDPASTRLSNAFGDDPIRLLGDVTSRGHRLACDERALEGILGVKNFEAFAQLARDAAEKAVA